MGICFFGTPEGTRTPDLLVRSQSLYPTELPAHSAQAPKYSSTSFLKKQALFSKIIIFIFCGGGVCAYTFSKAS